MKEYKVELKKKEIEIIQHLLYFEQLRMQEEKRSYRDISYSLNELDRIYFKLDVFA